MEGPSRAPTRMQPSSPRTRPRGPLRRCLGAAVTIGALVLAATAQTARAPRRPMNVLVIVLDDLGPDKLDFYAQTPDLQPGRARAPAGALAGGDRLRDPLPATPKLDLLRREGIWFTRAYGTPVCSSTRACLQTGRYGFRTGVGRATSTVSFAGDFELPDSEKLLSELLREGFDQRWPGPYRSGAFGKWHLSTTLEGARGHAVENGYHRFHGTLGNLGSFYRYDWIQHDAGSEPVVVEIDGSATHSTDTWHGSVTGRAALQWIRSQTGPFLAWVGFSPPHAPLQAPPEALLSESTRHELAAAGLVPGNILTPADPPSLVRLVYRALVEAVDAEIGKLIDGLPPTTRRNTMIFVVGDNGTVGTVVDPPNDPLHAKGEVYELGIRVPLIVNGPLVPRPVPSEGWRSEALVSAVDLWLTVAEVTGADASAVMPPDQLDSISFLPVILDPLSAGYRTTVFAQLYAPNGLLPIPAPSCYEQNDRSMSDGVYKYIRVQRSLSELPCGVPSYTERLFHLPSDPGEVLELLAAGPLSGEAALALDMLRAEMDALSGQ